MTARRDPDRLIHAFLLEGEELMHDQVYDAVRAEIEQTPQRAVIGSWRTPIMNRYLTYGLAAAGVILAIIGLRTLTASPTPGSSPSAEPSATAIASTPSSAYDDVLSGFLAARVAGAGAEEYLDLDNTTGDDIPLLYATTSGAPYERAEFEPVLGIEWPYAWVAFNVRLFAGDTVVEQLFFSGPDSPLLNYQPDGFGTDIAPTTENGQPVALPYSYFDGAVTLHAAHPWIMSGYGLYPFGRLIPEGPGVPPTTDGAQRHDGWDQLVLMADPALVGTGCRTGPGPADAEALAESIRSDPDLEATAPVAVSVGGGEALMMDVRIAAGTTISVAADEQGNLCDDGVLNPVLDQEDAVMYFDNGVVTGHATGDWMRLYLFDVPEGSSMRILAIAIIAPESRFERAVDAAAPIVDSVEFNVP